MFQVEHPYYFWLFLLVPILFILFFQFITWRKKTIKLWGGYENLLKLSPRVYDKIHRAKFILLVLCIALTIFGLVNPQIGDQYEKVKRKGVDVIVALDVSNSMNSEDVKPNRLERAKYFAKQFIGKMSNDRLGMIIFAGRAFLQMPLTVDYNIAGMYLASANPSQIGTQGTSFIDVCSVAIRSIDMTTNENKVLVIISDGEDHEAGAKAVIEEAHKKGLIVHTVGIGTETGGPIPFERNGVRDFKRDKQQNVVISKLNQPMLEELAQAGGGNYYNAAAGNKAAQALWEDINVLSGTEKEEMRFTSFASQFHWFLVPALLLVLAEFFIGFNKNRKKIF